MNPEADPVLALEDASHQRLWYWLRRHRLAYCLGIGALTLGNIFMGAPWWAFWPMIIWGLPLMVHFFFVKALTIVDEEVQERALSLRYKSYDFGHIRDLESRIVGRDYSVEPHSDDDLKR